MQYDVTSQGEMPTVGTRQVNEGTSLLDKSQPKSDQSRFSTVHISDHATVQFGDRYLTETHVYLGGTNEDQNSAKKVEELVSEKRYKLLLTSLAFSRMESRHLNISSAMPTTCDWLFGHEKYRNWMDDTSIHDHRGFLCIKGKPGTGKSTMMKVVLEETKRKYIHHLTLSYFFNARASSELENSGLGLYRSVLHQILGALPHMRQSFVDRFSSKITEEEDSVLPWTSVELQEFIIECFRVPASIRAFVFVDALDEGDQQDVRRMVSFLEDLTSHCTHSASGNIVRICFASRHYPLITVKRGISLVLEKEPAHADDIRKYINNKLVIAEDMVSSLLRLRIEERSGHIFLWVVLVVPMLNGMHDSGSSRDDLLAHLETLPDELHELFETVIFRDKTNISTTILLYQWLIFAAEPLGPEELYSAMTIDSRDFMEPEVEPTSATMDRCLLIWSRGLTEIVVHKKYLQQDRRTVQFIHETVREFLLAGKGLAALDKNLDDNAVGKSHDVLRRCCQNQIDYFAQRRRLWKSAGYLPNQALLRSLLERYPSRHAISKYAISGIFLHAGRAQRSGIPQTDFLWHFDIAQDFIFTDFLRQCRDFNISWSGGFPSGFYGDQSLLYVLLAQIHGEEVDELILYLIDQKKPPFDVEDLQFRHLLQAACVRGSTRIVRRLLSIDTNLNEVGGNYENQLLCRADDARSELDEEIEEFSGLVNYGLGSMFGYQYENRNPSLRSSFGFVTGGYTSRLQNRKLKRTLPIHSVSERLFTMEENTQSADLLSEFTQISIKNDANQSVDLYDLLKTGKLDLAEKLLTVNIDLERTFRLTETTGAETTDEEHILFRAARGGHIKIVEVLLRSSEEINAYRESAFRAAVIAGHIEIARLLQRGSFDHAATTKDKMTKHVEMETSALSKKYTAKKGLRASLSSIRRSYTTKRSKSQEQ